MNTTNLQIGTYIWLKSFDDCMKSEAFVCDYDADGFENMAIEFTEGADYHTSRNESSAGIVKVYRVEGTNITYCGGFRDASETVSCHAFRELTNEERAGMNV